MANDEMLGCAWSDSRKCDFTHEIQPIFKSARKWKEQCLLNGGSMFFEGHSVWSEDNVKNLEKYVRQEPIEEEFDENGEEYTFPRKLTRQLENAAPRTSEKTLQNLARLAAEIYWAMHLAVHMSVKTKITGTIERAQARDLKIDSKILAKSFGSPALPQPNDECGIGAAGQHYDGTRNWREWCMALELFLKLKAHTKSQRERILKNADEFSELCYSIKWNREWITDPKHSVLNKPQFFYMANHLLFPKKRERIWAAWQREDIIKAFGEKGTKDRLEIDKRLIKARARLERDPKIHSQQKEKNATCVDWYQPWIEKHWRRKNRIPYVPSTYRVNPNYKSAFATRPVRKRSGESPVRDPKFRDAVYARFEGECAFCNIRIEKMVEAAHVKPVNDGGRDDADNGILLCRNHHAAFDNHIVGIDPKTKKICISDADDIYTKDNLKIEKIKISDTTPPADALLQWRWNEFQKKQGKKP